MSSWPVERADQFALIMQSRSAHPLPLDAKAIHVESSPERLAHNLPVSGGLASHSRAARPT